MTRVLRPLVSALRAVLLLNSSMNGVYAAVTIAWITAIVVLRPHGAGSQTILVVTAGSHTADGFMLGGPLLAFGLDLIFGDIGDTPAAEYSPEPVRQREGLVATRDLQVRSDLVVHLAVRTESHANLSADWNTKDQAADFHSHRARCTGLHNYRLLT